MRWRAPLGALALLLAMATLTPAQVKDAADLLPANTVVWLEVRHPDKLAKELAALLKGSHLEDLPAMIARARVKAGDNANDFWFGGMWSEMLLFGSPEMLKELGRFQGAVFAVTGINKERGAEVVGVILGGDSNLPGFYARAALTFGSSMKIAAEPEGVPVYQERHRVWRKDDRPGGAAPEFQDGVVMAVLPDAIVLGNTVEGVKQVVLRAKGKVADPALSSVGAFKESAKLRERPGLFGYVDMTALSAQMDEGVGRLGPVAVNNWNALKAWVNPRAIKSATGSLTLSGGNLELQARADLDPKQPSPLLELLSSAGADIEMFQFGPKESVAALTVGVGDGEKKWATLIGVLDAMAKAGGDSDLHLPSKMLPGLEETVKLKFGKDVFGKMAGLSLVADLRGKVPENAAWFPMVVVRGTDADAAKSLEEGVLPKLMGMAARGDAPAPGKEEVNGQALRSLASEGMPWGAKLYYGRQGATLVLGQDKQRVAEALAGGAKKQGMLGEKRVAEAVKGLEKPLVVGVASLGDLLVEVVKLGPGRDKPRDDLPPLPPGGPGRPPKPAGAPGKLIADLTKAVEGMSPLVFSVQRQKDSLVVEARQASLRGVTAKVTNVWIEQIIESMVRGRNFGGGAVPELPPAPDPTAPANDKP